MIIKLQNGDKIKVESTKKAPLFPWLLNAEYADNWKLRTTPASRSRVLSGKGAETDKQYTERRKKETTKRTWRSDAADIAHGIGEGVLALHPYTAIPYFGAKVGLDFLNGNVSWQTALNASIPLFHLSPQAVGLKEVTNVALEDVANAGSKTARNLRVAREFNDILSKSPKTKEFIMPGLIGWAPKTKFKGYHASNENPFIPDFFREGWVLKTHNAIKGVYIANGKTPGYGFLTKRKYVHPVETTFEKPLIQLGEVKGRTKNGVRNLIERDALEQGADGIIFKGIADNLMQNLFIAKTLNPDTKIVNGSMGSNDSRANVFVQDGYGWKELSYPAYINHVWNRLKAKGVKTEPYDRSNTNQETIMNFFNKSFTPVFKLYPQANLKAHALEILRRMKNFGLDVDNTMGELPLYGKKSIRDLVTLNSGRTSYIGYYNKPGFTGTFFHNNGTSIVDPGYPGDGVSPLQSIVNTMHHERNMHGTLKFLTPEMWKLYEDFIKKTFTETTTDEFGRTIVRTHDDLMIPIGKGSIKKEELRATIGELVKNIYDTKAYNKAQLARAAEGGPDIKRYDLEIIRPHFEKVVDEMSDVELNKRLGSLNGYGIDYSEIGPKENPNFFEELRTLLKIAPASLPFLIQRKEEKK